MADTNFDILIIGSGPGGYVTAIRAAQLGFKVGVVERDFLGGICSNWGCIPTKALLRSAEIFHYMQHAKDYGLSADNVSFDPAAVIKRSRGVAGRMNNGVGFLLKKNKVTVIWGEAVIDAPGKVTVKASKTEAPKGAAGPGAYQAKHIIVATGARPRVLPGLEPDKKLVWTYFEAMNPDRMPKSLLVVGSGAIGIEFASFYRTMGAEVTVVEVLPQILPVEDAEIAAFARKAFEKQGIKIHTNAKVTKLDKKADSVTATIEADGKAQQMTVDRVIGYDANGDPDQFQQNVTAAEADTLSDCTFPFIGMRMRSSQCCNTPGRIPLPSPPNTNPTEPVRSTSVMSFVADGSTP